MSRGRLEHQPRKWAWAIAPWLAICLLRLGFPTLIAIAPWLAICLLRPGFPASIAMQEPYEGARQRLKSPQIGPSKHCCRLQDMFRASTYFGRLHEWRCWRRRLQIMRGAARYVLSQYLLWPPTRMEDTGAVRNSLEGDQA